MTDAEIQRRAQLGPLVMLARRGGVFAVGLLTTITIAHVLPPRAYGLAAMSAMMFSVAEIFKDMGITSGLMRKGVAADEEVNFLFWFNGATTIALSLLIAASSQVISRYFREPVVFWVILASLPGFVAGGFALQPRALMMRDLRFGEMAVIDIGVLLLQFSVTLSLAFAFRNVWSIVAGNVAAATASCGAYFVRSRWRPGRPAWARETRLLLGFGANTTFFSVSIFLSNNLAPILIGRSLGTSMLGQFNRGQTLYLLSVRNAAEPLLQALLPVLARLRNEPQAYRVTYLGLVRKIGILLTPGAVVLGFTAGPLVELVLGSRWREAGEVFAALTPALILFALSYPTSDLFITQDRTSEMGLIGLLELGARSLLITCAAPFGIVACALAFSLGSLLSAPLRVGLAGSKGPISVMDQIQALSPAIPVACFSLVGGMIAIGAEKFAPACAFSHLAIRGGLCLAFAGAAAWMIGPSRAAGQELLSAFITLRPRVEGRGIITPS